jgi:hypothetical protein
MIAIVITLIVIGILIYLEEKYLPIDAQFKQIIRWVVILCVVVWLLYQFGVLPLGKHDVPVPQLR